jgi:nitric oxide reductase activation protein
MIQSVVDRRAGGDPSEKIFSRKERRIRRISTLLLVDMSASTEESVPVTEASTGFSSASGLVGSLQGRKRIIDIEMEGLVVMTEALEALDDEYAIFGFSGRDRHTVDFYTIKDFGDPYCEDMKRRIGGITPKQGTRMGPAIRHATEKLRSVESDHRLMILLSDGFPQDSDYGEDRASREYGLHDTRMALVEARKLGIRPFCLTVDQAGNDYLRRMCDPNSYLVIEDIHSLPEVLPKVVESLML